jgi:hypothetical protein
MKLVIGQFIEITQVVGQKKSNQMTHETLTSIPTPTTTHTDTHKMGDLPRRVGVTRKGRKNISRHND